MTGSHHGHAHQSHDRHNHDHHSHDHHSHDHHSHGPAVPHPAHPAPWSILRMNGVARVGAALAVSAGLWLVVALAMRPA